MFLYFFSRASYCASSLLWSIVNSLVQCAVQRVAMFNTIGWSWEIMSPSTWIAFQKLRPSVCFKYRGVPSSTLRIESTNMTKGSFWFLDVDLNNPLRRHRKIRKKRNYPKYPLLRSLIFDRSGRILKKYIKKFGSWDLVALLRVFDISSSRKLTIAPTPEFAMAAMLEHLLATSCQEVCLPLTPVGGINLVIPAVQGLVEAKEPAMILLKTWNIAYWWI